MGRRPLCWTGRAVGVNSYDLRMADRRPPIRLRSRDPGHWPRLCRVADRYAAELTPPQPAGAGCCAMCRGPALLGHRWCYQCGRHRDEAPGILANVVVPIAYAVKGGRHATSLWRYKSGGPAAAAARASLRALALVFLRDHGACIWRQAAMPPPRWLALPAQRPGAARRSPAGPAAAAVAGPAPGAADPAARRAPGPGAQPVAVPGRERPCRGERPAHRRHLGVRGQRTVRGGGAADGWSASCGRDSARAAPRSG